MTFTVSFIDTCCRGSRLVNLHCDTFFSLQKSKFDEHRVLGPETIENCRELIETRQVVVDLMESCERISERLSHHVSQLTSSGDLGGQRIQHQPSKSPLHLFGLPHPKPLSTSHLASLPHTYSVSLTPSLSPLHLFCLPHT